MGVRVLAGLAGLVPPGTLGGARTGAAGRVRATVCGRRGPDRAGLAWPAGPAAAFTVTERLTSDFGADFGAPCEIPQADATPADAGQAQQMTALVRAAWEIFDLTAATAPPPRGHLCS